MRIFESQDSVAAARQRQQARVKSQRVTPAEFFAAQSKRVRKKKPRRFDPTATPLEHQEQANLITWVVLYQKQIPELCNVFAIPNQGAARLKNLQTEGVLKGVSDIFIAVPKPPRHGFFLELKRVKKGKVSAEQYDFMDRMSRYGYEVGVAYGAEDAWQAILKYLGVKDPR